MLVEIPPKVAVSSFMGYLKGKSSLMIYEKFPELRYKYRNREFWCRGYYVDTAVRLDAENGVIGAAGVGPVAGDQGAVLCIDILLASSKSFAGVRPYLRDETRSLVT